MVVVYINIRILHNYKKIKYTKVIKSYLKTFNIDIIYLLSEFNVFLCRIQKYRWINYVKYCFGNYNYFWVEID
jgi:magnesium-transporting ATPase (P-type)